MLPRKCASCGALQIPPWTVFFMGVLAVLNLAGAIFGYGDWYRWIVAITAIAWLAWALVQWRRDGTT